MSALIDERVFDAFPKLESKRLLYRAYDQKDAMSLLTIRGHAAVSKYLDSAVPKSIEDTTARIRQIDADFRNRKGITWAIIDKQTHHLIGDFGIWRLDKPNARGEIGYVLHPDFWNRGFMKEAMKTVLTFAFKTMHLHSLEANVNPENTNSIALLSRMGFKKEAYFRENYYFEGRFLDSEIYSLLEEDLL